MDVCEFEASLVYRVSPRTGSIATQRNPVLGKILKRCSDEEAKEIG